MKSVGSQTPQHTCVLPALPVRRGFQELLVKGICGGSAGETEAFSEWILWPKTREETNSYGIGRIDNDLFPSGCQLQELLNSNCCQRHFPAAGQDEPSARDFKDLEQWAWPSRRVWALGCLWGAVRNNHPKVLWQSKPHILGWAAGQGLSCPRASAGMRGGSWGAPGPLLPQPHGWYLEDPPDCKDFSASLDLPPSVSSTACTMQVPELQLVAASSAPGPKTYQRKSHAGHVQNIHVFQNILLTVFGLSNASDKRDDKENHSTAHQSNQDDHVQGQASPLEI